MAVLTHLLSILYFKMSKLSVVIMSYRAEQYSEEYLKLVLKSLAEHYVENYQVIFGW